MSNPSLGPIHLSTAAWRGPEAGPLQAFADAEHPWAAWADAHQAPPPPPLSGPKLGAFAKALRQDPLPGPWRLAGGDAGERQRSRQEWDEMLRRAGAWGCPFLILPEGEADAPPRATALGRLASLLDALGAQAEREGVALWLPWSGQARAYLPAPVESAAWLGQLGVPAVRVALRWAEGPAEPWAEGEAWAWQALGPSLGGLLLGQAAPPEGGWRLPPGAPDRLLAVWWPPERQGAEGLRVGAQAWREACCGPPEA